MVIDEWPPGVVAPPPPAPPGTAFQFPDHLDLTLHQPDIASTTQKPTPDQQLTDRVSKLEKDVQNLVKDRGNQPPSPSSGRFVVSFVEGVTLSDKAPQIIQQAVNSAKTATTVLCNGYSDTIGDDTPRGRAVNMRLSNQRAAKVARELVQEGVPVENIKVRGYGSHPEGRTVEVLVE